MAETKMRALISVTDKKGLEIFKRLTDSGWWEIISTGGTALKLKELGIPFIPVEDITGFPEMMGGRLKTLHPKVFGGILANRANPEHMRVAAEHGIKMIDLVVVNLYNFAGKPDIEQIDIGGPSLLRAAAKNCSSVTVLIDPQNYEWVVNRLVAGPLGLLNRVELAGAVFKHTARYDAVIHDWFKKQITAGLPAFRDPTASSH